MQRDPCGGCQARRTFLTRALSGLAWAWAGTTTPVFASGRRAAGSGEVSYPMPSADGVTIDRDNEVILVRHAGVVMAFALSCPHQRTMLKWIDTDNRFQCPKHKSRYQPTGEFISGRATRNMDRYPVRRDGGNVAVNVDHLVASDKDPSGWAAAAIKV